MPGADYSLDELKHAYQVLGVPLDSSSHSIKQAYRGLMKRWHPDHCAPGTMAHAEGTQMTVSINEAYAKIERAPLRYHVDSYAQAEGRGRYVERPPTNEPAAASSETLLITDLIEFWVRFVFGALAGALVSISLLLEFYEHPVILALSVAGVILGLGFASARFGDKAWHSVLRFWWFWR